MNQLTKKHYTLVEKIAFSLCVVSTLVLAYSLTQFKSRKMKMGANDASQINYEMAKLKTADGLYSLENREIELDYKALEAKKVAAAKAAQVKAVADKSKKEIEAKKAAAQKQQAQKAVQKNAAAKNVKPNAVNPYATESQETTASPENFKNPTANYNAGNYSSPVAAQEQPTEDKIRSFEDWKTEIFAAQNREVILKLTAAYKKGEVPEETFQLLVEEMLKGDDKMVGLGLYALRANPTYTNYVKLIKLQNQVNATYSTYVQESLMAYHQNGLGILKQSLTNPERAIVLKTLEIIKLGVNNIRSGSTTTMIDPRYRRTNNTSQFSISSYLTFLPVLQNIVNTSGDSDIVRLANENISTINSQQSVAALN